MHAISNCAAGRKLNDLSAGEYPDNGPVMVQLRKKFKDAEKPALNIEIDPWTRYEALAMERRIRFNKKPRKEQEAYIHPVVSKAMRMWDYFQKISKTGKTGQIEYRGKELISINGRVREGFKQHGGKSVTGGVGKKPIGSVTPNAGEMGALIAGALPKAGGIGVDVTAAPLGDGGIGALIVEASPKSVPEGSAVGPGGGLAALMMGNKVRRTPPTESVGEGAAESAKASKLEEMQRRIEILSEELDSIKAEVQALIAS